MNFSQRLTFLFSAPMFDADDLEGLRVSQIIAAIERMGFQVIKARRLEDAEIAVQTDAAIGCMVVDWGKKGIEGKAASLINLMRKRGLDMPIVVLVRRKRFEDIPVEVLDFIDGYVFLAEETPEFIARNLVSRLKQYADTLKTPFFGALVDYQEEGNQLWTCPGHNGGVFYSRSPIGRIFVEHLGEAVFRDDLDNSILELGDLLTHEGPALQAQKEAAAIFGAEKTYFVLNGTSSSNKIVCTNLIAEDDLVLFDRNNHKAAHQGALLMGGGIPIYLSTDRNAYGLIGPIRPEDLDETTIRERIRDNPLVKDKEAWKRERPFRAAVIEQCTYDGTIYDAERIVERIGHLCDYVMFDEAWAGFMKFHPLYERRFAMGLRDLNEASPGIIATQSAHKQLASFSQASQIHMRDRHIKGQRRRVEHRRFNEGFMQFASTSPFYPLFASLDVGAQMMKGRSGEVLWDDAIRLGIELRKKLRAVRREFEEKERDPARRWFFDPFVPQRVSIRDAALENAAHDVPWESVSTDLLARDPRYWALAPGEAWHGFQALEAGFAITDPAKLTLLTPGFDRATGAYEAHGVPAPVVAQYLRENRVVSEKNDLNSLLFLLTPGVEFEQGGNAGVVAGRLQAAARRQHSPRRRHAGIRRQAAGALSRQTAQGPMRRDARVLSRVWREPIADGAIRRQASAGRSHDAARSLAPPGAQQRRLSAACRTRRPDRNDALGRVSARHRDHRSRRTADRASAADDRLSQDVREERQCLPRLRSRGAGALSRGRRSGRDPILYLCGPRAVGMKRLVGSESRRPVGLAAA